MHNGVPIDQPFTAINDAVVEQVILYWESGHQDGDLSADESDETLNVNGTQPLVILCRGDFKIDGTIVRAKIAELQARHVPVPAFPNCSGP